MLPVVTIVAVLRTVLSCVAVVCYTIVHVVVYVCRRCVDRPLSQRSVCDCNKRIL